MLGVLGTHLSHLQQDMTNLEAYTATSDAIQLRPFEVLVEEWAKLRNQVRRDSSRIICNVQFRVVDAHGCR